MVIVRSDYYMYSTLDIIRIFLAWFRRSYSTIQSHPPISKVTILAPTISPMQINFPAMSAKFLIRGYPASGNVVCMFSNIGIPWKSKCPRQTFLIL